MSGPARKQASHFTRVVGSCALILTAALVPAEASSDLPPLDPAKPISESERAQRLAELQPGMPIDQIQHLIGAPRSTCRQILYHRYLEQWLYDSPFSIRLEVDCLRGQEARLLSVQPLGSAKP
jgi:hypothetical protein